MVNAVAFRSFGSVCFQKKAFHSNVLGDNCALKALRVGSLANVGQEKEQMGGPPQAVKVSSQPQIGK